jgi:hypothetical protein
MSGSGANADSSTATTRRRAVRLLSAARVELEQAAAEAFPACRQARLRGCRAASLVAAARRCTGSASPSWLTLPVSVSTVRSGRPPAIEPHPFAAGFCRGQRG